VREHHGSSPALGVVRKAAPLSLASTTRIARSRAGDQTVGTDPLRVRSRTSQVELRVAEVVSGAGAEVEEAAQLTVSLGSEQRKLVAGIASTTRRDSSAEGGRRRNLEPAKLMASNRTACPRRLAMARSPCSRRRDLRRSQGAMSALTPSRNRTSDDRRAPSETRSRACSGDLRARRRRARRPSTRGRSFRAPARRGGVLDALRATRCPRIASVGPQGDRAPVAPRWASRSLARWRDARCSLSVAAAHVGGYGYCAAVALVGTRTRCGPPARSSHAMDYTGADALPGFLFVLPATAAATLTSSTSCSWRCSSSRRLAVRSVVAPSCIRAWLGGVSS